MFKAFCINLAKRSDRWEYMSDLASHAGFSLERVDAVDASDPQNANALDAMKNEGPTGTIGRGALACTLSHAKAWRMFLDTSEPYGVFLEDDVIVSEDFASVVSEVLAHNPAFDLIKLECGGSAMDGLVLGKSVFESGSRQLRPCHQVATDAAAYVLSRNGAMKALEGVEATDVPVDHFLFYPLARKGNAGLTYAIIDPAIAIQDRSIGSNISASRYTDSKFSRMRKRTFYEAAPAPMMISQLLFKGAKVRKVNFVKTLGVDRSETSQKSVSNGA